MKKVLLTVLLVAVTSGCVQTDAETPEASPEKPFEVTEAVEGLESPWGTDFISGDEALITESGGSLQYVNTSSGEKTSIEGVPQVSDMGQGGLLDVAYSEGYVYLTYSAEEDHGTATRLGRGLLDLDRQEITGFEVLYTVRPIQDTVVHYGSRIALDDDYVYFSSGDRGEKDFEPGHNSQDLSNDIGAIIRLYRNGTVPEYNPFADDEEASNAIYSYGHRNPQGLTFYDGDLWQSEHGEEDGDEINIIQEGGNYGWPVAHTGCEYGTDTSVGDSPFDMDEVVDPVFHWECGTGGFPPGGITFYEGDELPEFHGNLFVAGLAKQSVARFNVEGEVTLEEKLLEDRNQRIRDVESSPGGGLYVLPDGGEVPLLKLENRSEKSDN